MTASSRIERYFLAGLLTVVPAWGTFLILSTLFEVIDTMTVDFFDEALGIKVPGSGLISFVTLVLGVGVIMTHFIGHQIHRSFEKSIERIPWVRSIYHTLKSMSEVLNFRERFGQSKIVAFPFPREGLWALGFVMGPPPIWLQVSQEGPLIMVFVPTAIHPFTGYLAFVPEMKTHPIRLPPEEAMKMEFSAGLYNPALNWLAPVSHQ